MYMNLDIKEIYPFNANSYFKRMIFTIREREREYVEGNPYGNAGQFL